MEVWGAAWKPDTETQSQPKTEVPSEPGLKVVRRGRTPSLTPEPLPEGCILHMDLESPRRQMSERICETE